MDGWKTILSFWVSAYFQKLLLLVSGSGIIARKFIHPVCSGHLRSIGSMNGLPTFTIQINHSCVYIYLLYMYMYIYISIYIYIPYMDPMGYISNHPSGLSSGQSMWPGTRLRHHCQLLTSLNAVIKSSPQWPAKVTDGFRRMALVFFWGYPPWN